MDVEVHRAGRTFYAHSAVLLNTPNRELSSFLSVNGWQYVAAAKYLGLPGVVNRALSSFSPSTAATGSNDATLSGADVESLLARQANNELSPEQMAQELASLVQRRRREQSAGNPVTITQDLVGASGVQAPVWEEAGQEMLEALLPFEIGRPVRLGDGGAPAGARATATRLRLEMYFSIPTFPLSPRPTDSAGLPTRPMIAGSMPFRPIRISPAVCLYSLIESGPMPFPSGWTRTRYFSGFAPMV